MPIEWHRAEYTISTDPARIDLDTVFNYLSNESYWAKGRPPEVVARSIEHSENFGVYRGTTQVGFARVVTDYATFAWIADVFILPQEQGHGLGKWLIECVVAHPELQGLRLWSLRTRDAHSLYVRYGFEPLKEPERGMERRNF